MADFEQLATFKLRAGKHDNPKKGLCALEAVAWLEGIEHTDRPDCVAESIASYVRAMNDWLFWEPRQKLIPYLPRLVGTVSPEHEEERIRYLLWQAVTVFVPLALRKVGRKKEANELAALPLGASLDVLYYAVQEVRNALHALNIDSVRLKQVISNTWSGLILKDVACVGHAGGYLCHMIGAPAWKAMFATLDGVLAIGPSGRPFAKPVEERVVAYKELVEVA